MKNLKDTATVPCYYLLFMLSFFACSAHEKNASELLAYLKKEQNGLNVHGNAGDFTLQAQYEPIDCLIAKQKRSDNIKKVEYLDMKKELEGLQYFTVNLGTSLRGTNIANYETTDEAEIQKRLYYLSFKMQKDFKLVEGSDTLPCRLYHFEKMNDFANVKTISLAFDKRTEGNDKDKTLIVDSPLLNSEPIKLNFDIKNIKNIPPLKTL